MVTENNSTSLFIITSNCFTVRVSNQLAFRVRRSAKDPQNLPPLWDKVCGILFKVTKRFKV